MKNKKPTTIYDIAKKLNINASSVSRALANNINVSEKTKRLVLKTAKELNYKPNSIASNLRKGNNQTIGIVVPHINQNYFSNVIAGIEEIAYQKGYNIIICQSNESYQKEVKSINALINQQVNCIVISTSADFDKDDHLQTVLDHGINLIQFDRVAPNLETHKVLNDTEQVSMEAVSHLIEQGYKRIALLEGPQNLSIFRERKAGYIAALKKHNLPIVKELIKENAWTKELGEKATGALLDLPNPPDAIFASTSDFAALGALNAAKRRTLNVPQQLGICGYSNESFTEITNPTLTTIDQFSTKMGKAIADLYFEEIKDKLTTGPKKTINIRPELIKRASSQKV
ncbi:LacI family DNA-binding transcriptional regulator [Pedobacter sp. SD-b]|uniref:LacI family DNA-binding transcriptional regulator n=1 Tax=Pedobacter segetis TaxID=2793069 RepID=A0ABS1BGX9_9SPHI|nr:LacI family DNA-binding transcriptional regulator [Pedobacter segetis]MBK0382113.1 LacI family DNA-binding transcriptional regulator [Pedobacter segetis]